MKKWIFLILSSLLIQACSTSDGGVAGAYPGKAPKYTEGASIGAVTGAAVGGFAGSSNIPLGIVLGAMLGAPVGAYYDSQGLINQLQAQGITIVRLGDIVQVVVPNDLIFDLGGNEVQRDAYPMLDQIVFFLKQYGDVNIAITGHADAVGTNAEQIHRAYLQAQSLATYLWSHGINSERIKLYSAGNKQTTASLRTVNGNGYNRRVDLVFWKNEDASSFNAYTVGKKAQCWYKIEPSECAD
ncbi:MAG: hypothetical protein CMF49_09935 [Legionellales bacterium]|nr:hypothetical protein [Legionellales bacterium]